MSDYSDYRVSQARSERIRQQSKRQKRVALLGAVALAAIVAFLAATSSLRGAPVAPPNVVVTWPSAQKYGKRTFNSVTDKNGDVDLGSVLMRRDEPFTVALQNAANWDATIVSPSSTTSGPSAKWKPAKDGETLKIFARKQSSGWRKMLAWTQPKQELHLVALAPKEMGANRFSLRLENEGMTVRAVWLSQNVSASSLGAKESVVLEWDQRAIPLLEGAARAIAYRGPQPGPGRSMPLPPPRAPRWNVAQGFGTARAKGDNGSYFDLNGADALDGNAAITMTKLARHIAARAPAASIKWILKEVGSSDARATLRLQFDGSGARAGWVKRAGEAEATPLRWWNKNLGEDEIRERLAPSSPR